MSFTEALLNEAILSFKLNEDLVGAIRSPHIVKKVVCVDEPTTIVPATSTSTTPSGLPLLPLSVGKYTHAMPKGSTAFIFVVALFGAIQFISPRL